MIIDPLQVADARLQAKLTLAEVAERMKRCGLPGTQASWVGMVEHGKLTDIPARQVTALAAALEVSAADILPPAEATGLLLIHLADQLRSLSLELAQYAERLAPALDGTRVTATVNTPFTPGTPGHLSLIPPAPVGGPANGDRP
jgi:transcriptional regulator with XRE-family HTH domain